MASRTVLVDPHKLRALLERNPHRLKAVHATVSARTIQRIVTSQTEYPALRSKVEDLARVLNVSVAQLEPGEPIRSESPPPERDAPAGLKAAFEDLGRVTHNGLLPVPDERVSRMMGVLADAIRQLGAGGFLIASGVFELPLPLRTSYTVIEDATFVALDRGAVVLFVFPSDDCYRTRFARYRRADEPGPDDYRKRVADLVKRYKGRSAPRSTAEPKVGVAFSDDMAITPVRQSVTVLGWCVGGGNRLVREVLCAPDQFGLLSPPPSVIPERDFEELLRTAMPDPGDARSAAVLKAARGLFVMGKRL